MTLALFTAVLLAGVPQDLETKPGTLNGPSSARLAAPVKVRLDDALGAEPTLIHSSSGTQGSTQAPRQALEKYALAVARRHHEQAHWGEAKGADRSVVVKSVAVSVSPGPNYQAQVVVERLRGAQRKGQATGSGYAQAVRSQGERVAQGYAAPFAALAGKDSQGAKPDQDAEFIEQATLRALDSALLQLAAVASGEEQVEAAQLRAQEMLKASQKPRK